MTATLVHGARCTLLLALFFLPIVSFAERPAGRGAWTTVGPEGGKITCFAVAPSNPSIVYAGTGTGRVFRSNDSGSSWSLASEGIASHEPYLIFSLSVDSNDPLTAYAGADVVFKTSDGGQHWSILPDLPVNDGNTNFVVADTATSRVVYVGASNGLFKSSDGGGTWSQLGNGLPDGGQVSSVAVARSNPAILYAFAATSTGTVLFKSSDKGDHWAPTSIVDNFGLRIVVDPRNPDIVFADRQRSFDGGQTSLANDLDVVVSAVSPDGSIVYGTNFGPVLYESGDRGATWNVLATGPPDEGIESLLVAGSFLLAGFRQAGVYRSLDGGRSWQSSSSGLTAFHIACFAVAPTAPERLWVGTGILADASARTETSPDRGGHWVIAHDGDLHVDAIAADTNDPNTAFVAALTAQPSLYPYAYASDFRRTFDAGATWNDELLSCSTTNLLEAGPRHSGLLYWINYPCHNPINGPVLYGSTDGGATFTTLAIETGTVAIDPTDFTRLYRSDFLNSVQVFRSDDSGQNWTPTAPFDDSAVSQIAVGDDASATVLAAGSKGIWRSMDLGSSWTLVDGVPPPSSGYITVTTNPISAGSFVASVNGRFFVSANAGLAWEPLTSSGFTGEPVSQLIGSKDGDLFAMTPAEIFALHLIGITRPLSPSPPVVFRHR